MPPRSMPSRHRKLGSSFSTRFRATVFNFLSIILLSFSPLSLTTLPDRFSVESESFR